MFFSSLIFSFSRSKLTEYLNDVVSYQRKQSAQCFCGEDGEHGCVQGPQPRRAPQWAVSHTFHRQFRRQHQHWPFQPFAHPLLRNKQQKLGELVDKVFQEKDFHYVPPHLSKRKNKTPIYYILYHSGHLISLCLSLPFKSCCQFILKECCKMTCLRKVLKIKQSLNRTSRVVECDPQRGQAHRGRHERATECPSDARCSPGKSRLGLLSKTSKFTLLSSLSLPPEEQLNVIIMITMYYQSSHPFRTELSNLNQFSDDPSLQFYAVTDEKIRVQCKVML